MIWVRLPCSINDASCVWARGIQSVDLSSLGSTVSSWLCRHAAWSVRQWVGLRDSSHKTHSYSSPACMQLSCTNKNVGRMLELHVQSGSRLSHTHARTQSAWEWVAGVEKCRANLFVEERDLAGGRQAQRASWGRSDQQLTAWIAGPAQSVSQSVSSWRAAE